MVEALRNAVTAAYPRLSHRYYALKARWLGLDKLQVWDRNAPLPTETPPPSKPPSPASAKASPSSASTMAGNGVS